MKRAYTSLLETRACAAWRGLMTGSTRGQSSAGDAIIQTSLAVARVIVAEADEQKSRFWILRQDRVDQKIAELADSGESAVEAIAGVVPVGTVRRPQDHNGIVDNVVAVMAHADPSSYAVARGCALSGFLAALLDGWGVEAALAQALFVARRGATFGRKVPGLSFEDVLTATIGRWEEIRQKGSPTDGLSQDPEKPWPWSEDPVLDAIAWVYTWGRPPIEDEVTDGYPAPERVVGFCMFSSMLAGALTPESVENIPRICPQADVSQAADECDPQELRVIIDGLLRIRTAIAL